MGVQAPSSRQNGLAIQRANARKDIRLNHIVKEIRQQQIKGSKLEVWSVKNFRHITYSSHITLVMSPQIFLLFLPNFEITWLLM